MMVVRCTHTKLGSTMLFKQNIISNIIYSHVVVGAPDQSNTLLVGILALYYLLFLLKIVLMLIFCYTATKKQPYHSSIWI